MIEIIIPGFKDLRIDHVVCDYNGTLAADGELLPGVRELLVKLSSSVDIHVITADTFGLAKAQLSGLPATLNIIPNESQSEEKLSFISKLGTDTVFAIGNGRNDKEMLASAAVGVALIQKEGASSAAMASADLICSSIIDALNLLLNPKRLIATLRS
jgi:P-type E1-E2 ATPase